MQQKLRERQDICLECGPGWDKMIEPIVDYIDKVNSERTEEEKIEIAQIKEKFGQLRIYVHGHDVNLSDMIDDAEMESYNTCELCGSKEDVGQTSDGWIMTCCRRCIEDNATKNNKERKWYSHKTRKIEIIKPN